jgi:hypothetical protein
MQYIIIGVMVTLVLLIGLVMLAVVWAAHTVRGQIRRRTAELITLYDGYSGDGEPEDDEDGEGEEAPETARVNRVEQAGTDQFWSGGGSSVLDETQQISAAHYLDRELPHMYRQIRSQFYFNPAAVLSKLPIADVSRTGGGLATKLLRSLDNDTVFSMSQLSREEQFDLLTQVVGDEYGSLLTEFDRPGEKFDILDFCDFLQVKSTTESQPIKVYVPADMLNYRTFSDNVEVVADLDICDGLQIEADNMIYDFAIKGREIS